MESIAVKKRTNNKLILSEFSHIFRLKRKICIFHSLLLKKVFLTQSEFNLLRQYLNSGKVKDPLLINKLYEMGFLVKSRLEDYHVYRTAQKLVSKWELKTLFLVVTNECNFKCKYCFENLNDRVPKKMMTKTIAKKAIDAFARETKKDIPKTIFFYGGEPLLNWELIKFSVKYAHNLMERNILKQPCNFDVITNGSLITESIAKFAKKWNISFGVSLDGFKHNHNQMRVYNKNLGTFDDVIKGINTLRAHDIDYSILCTVGPHNLDELPEICEFFIKELGAKNINLTLPLHKSNGKYPFSKKLSIDYLFNQIIKAVNIVRKYGAYEGTVFKHLISFVEEELFRGECDGMGCQVVVTPDGKIGPCLAFINKKGFFIKSDLLKFDIKKKKIFKKFAKGIALLNPQCRRCPALGICGGGCIYNRFVKNGKFESTDEFFCEFMKKLLKQFILELAEYGT